MKDIKNKKKLQIILFVMIAVITLGVGYAAISAVNLIVNGNATAIANQNNFKVVFKTANITAGTGTASINNQDATVAYFDVSGLSTVGDTAVATYTIKNESVGVGADVGLKIENTNLEYFQVTEAIEDNKLQAGDSTTATVTVQMIKTPISDSVSTSITGTLTATPLENDSALGGTSVNKVAGQPDSFADDSWATIKKAVQDNNTSLYNVGDTKTVAINGRNYTVRLSNKITGNHCGDEDTAYSQTACGFVVEFIDIISIMKMMNSNSNVGGYPASLIYDYLKNTLYDELPSDLQTAIKPTRVISGHGSSDPQNFTTIDKLYLLTGTEVFGIDAGGKNFRDTASGSTHQLEYYSNNGVTFDSNNWTGTNYDKAIKKYYSRDEWWWLRSAESNYYHSFIYVRNSGRYHDYLAGQEMGVAPAFRIG